MRLYHILSTFESYRRLRIYINRFNPIAISLIGICKIYYALKGFSQYDLSKFG